jgi:hypothetical protein
MFVVGSSEVLLQELSKDTDSQVTRVICLEFSSALAEWQRKRSCDDVAQLEDTCGRLFKTILRRIVMRN